MPTPRNLRMQPGMVVRCAVLRQRDNIQIYLPRAAVRYMGVTAGEAVDVTAMPDGMVTVRRVVAPVPPGTTPAAAPATARPRATPATPAPPPAPERPAARAVQEVRQELNQEMSEFRVVRRARTRR